jgi:hypothetical protein
MCDCSAFTVGGVHGDMICLGRKLRIWNSAKMSISVVEYVNLSRGLETLRDYRNLWFI